MPVFNGKHTAPEDPALGGASVGGAESGDPLAQLKKILHDIEIAVPEIHLVSADGHSSISPDDIEKAFGDFAQASGDTTTYNKWVKLDSKRDSSLKEYKAELRGLIAGMVQAGVANEAVQAQVPEPQAKGLPQAPTPVGGGAGAGADLR